MIDEFLKNISNKISLSKFLSLEEQEIVKKSKYFYYLLPTECERKRAIVSKDEIYDNNINISIIKITYNKKFGEIKHKDVLGSLIGLGIKRECIGDIILDNNIYVYVISEMESFILNNLYKVGNIVVNVSLALYDEIKDIKVSNYLEKQIIVSSYRLDTIISERCCYSREKAKKYITLKNVKVNGIVNTNPDYIVKINDLVSIHKFGRLIIKEEVKKTNKDKFVLKINITK